MDDIVNFNLSFCNWYINNDGNFTEQPELPHNSNTIKDILTHDMDNDGFTDIIIACDLAIVWYKNNSLQIVTQPQNQYNKCNGQTATLSVSAVGATQYQWYKSSDGTNFTQLTDNEIYSGSNSPTLNVVFNANVVDNFYCEVANASKSLNSDTVAIYKNYSAPDFSVKDTTLYLDASGTATLHLYDIVTVNSYHCGIADTTASQVNFSCDDVGITPVHIFVSDINGNQTQHIAQITVTDTINPQPTTQNATLYLDVNGNATLTQSDVVTQASDNCSNATITISQTDFDCSDLGDNSITITATDEQGNYTNQNVTVTVEDTIRPVISCVENQTVTANENNVYIVNNNEFDPVSTDDNCSVFSLSNDFNNSNTLAGVDFQPGNYTIVWTAILQMKNLLLQPNKIS